MFKKVFLLAVMLVLGSSSAFAAGKTLRVSANANWPPMEFLSPDKEMIGFTVDLLNAIGQETGVTMEFRNVAWAGIFAELAAGRTDIIASSVSITPERIKVMDFSEPYYLVKQAVVVPRGVSYSSVDELKGKRLGAQITTTGFFAGRKINKDIKSYDSVGYAIEDLKNGNLDAVLCDEPVAADYALKEGSDNARALKIAFIVEEGDPEYYGFAVRKGDAETLEILNTGLQAVREKGIEQELLTKWFGER